LETPDGVTVETAGVWAPTANEMAWRLGLDETGQYDLRLLHNGLTVTKSLIVSDDWSLRRSPVRHNNGLFYRYYHSGEDPIPEEVGITWIEIPYPMEEVNLLGLELQWIFLFLIVSILFAFAIRGRMGVTF
ncbi:MAG: hypothetical protein AAGA81_07960, partial [Acidobacteriota bacterium]